MSSPVASSDRAGSPTTETSRSRSPGQLRSLLGAAHPRQAVAFAVVVGALVALMGRPLREVLVSAAAVLAVQLLLGLLNDVWDVEEDQATQAPGKPVAAGHLPRGNATYAATVLLLLSVPLALQNGLLAGALLLGTLAVGAAHDRWLHRGLLSWVGWAATFALLTGFVSYGGWGNEAEGSAPVVAFTALAALLGVLVHVATSLPDLVTDHRGAVRHLPLRIALRTGAPKLFFATVVGLVVVLGAMVYVALTDGIAV
jgi:4-hydroxybenzoate polyprenyltransferase